MKRMMLVGLIVLFLMPVFADAQSSDSAIIVRDLNERLERNKAELIKEIQNQNKKNEELITQSIDENFKVLDERMNNFFKRVTRDIAIIMVSGFLVGFTISQILKIKVEQMKRKALVKRECELQNRVENLQQKAMKLMSVVKELKQIDKKYSSKLKTMNPQKFVNAKTIALGVLSFVAGVGVMYLVVN